MSQTKWTIYTKDNVELTRQPTAVALGVFDGVHVGHRALLTKMCSQAREAGLRTAVVTFFPHPRSVVQDLTGRIYLTTLEERIAQLHGADIDMIILYPFTNETRQMRAADFVKEIQDHFGLVQIWSGDFGFGYKREGTVGYLNTFAAEYGFSVHEYSQKLIVGEDTASSSRIREALKNGNLEDVAACLGRPYRMSGIVIQGDQRGRTIGFPTANLEIWDEQLIPAYGVYATHAHLEDGTSWMAATNIGVRPTVDGLNLRIEAHLLDFDGDLYGQMIHLDFLGRVRPEKKFNGLDELKKQIDLDVETVRQKLA